MKNIKRAVLTLYFFSLSILFCQNVFPQETQRGKIREILKQHLEEKQEGKKSRMGRLQFGLGGKDYRIPLKWIIESGKKNNFIYKPGDYGRKIKFGGHWRFYEIHVSSVYNSSSPAPVVLVFHGGGGYPATIRYDSGMDMVSDREGFIAVYPGGSGKFDDRLLTWNAGGCCDYAVKNNIDDVGFTRALLDDLGNFFNIDSKRIYATGISNGAQMSYRLAVELSGRIAAIAPVAATVALENKKLSRPISIIHFHGLEDQNAPYQGGIGPRGVSGYTHLSVKENIGFLLSQNECSSTPADTKRVGKAVMTRYGSCKDNSEIILWTLEDGGHSWPGGKMILSEERFQLGQINQDISASDLMWEFFKRHPNK